MTIGDKIKRKKSVTGYKMALKDEKGKYRSLYTYQLYQLNKPIQKAVKRDYEEVPWFFKDFVQFTWNEKYNGFTSVYQNKEDCKLRPFHSIPEKSADSIVLLQVTLSDDLHEGVYDHPIYLGKKIIEIKEIKEFEK